MIEANGDSIEQCPACLLRTQLTRHSQKNSEDEIARVAEVNQHCFLEESEQWLENVDGIQLVLTSGKLVLLDKYWWKQESKQRSLSHEPTIPTTEPSPLSNNNLVF